MGSAPKLGSYSEKVPTGFRLPDEDMYIIKLDDFGDVQKSLYIDKETGEYPLRIELKFKIVSDLSGDEEFEGCNCSAWFNLDLNPNDKNSIWHPLLALDPTSEPEPDQEIEEYRGKTCKGPIIHAPSKKGEKDANGNIKIYANLGKLIPLKKNKQAKSASSTKANPLIAPDEDE